MFRSACRVALPLLASGLRTKFTASAPFFRSRVRTMMASSPLAMCAAAVVMDGPPRFGSTTADIATVMLPGEVLIVDILPFYYYLLYLLLFLISPFVPVWVPAC